MLANGVIDPENRTFDIAGVNETNTSILTLGNTLRLSYRDESGQLVQLTKQLTASDDNIEINNPLGISPALDNGIGGYAQRVTKVGNIKALTSVDWSDTSKLITKTFTDSNGVTRTAVLLPVTLS